MNWIPVTERLPEEGKRVIAWIGGEWNDWTIASLVEGKWARQWNERGPVTHWMPIEPPSVLE